MKEMTMLDLDRLDLVALADALEDHSPEHHWWLDPRTGTLDLDAESGDHVYVEPTPSGVAYADMEDFIARVRDPGARTRLQRAIAGRGAFRRFKDELLDHAELRQAWFAFGDARARRRAIEWLAAQGLVEPEAAERALGEPAEPEPRELSGPFDPHAIARRVAGDLRELYGERLLDVVLFGSWARGDAHPDSDIDLMVVLDRVDSPWEEGDRMDAILWRHSFDNDTVVTAFAVASADFDRAGTPLLLNVRAEGVPVT